MPCAAQGRPACNTCAGNVLRERGARGLFSFGLLALLVGAAWSLLLPWNKNLWTPSYAVWAVGWATVLLALCHSLFDVRGWRPFGRSMGINAIAAYAGSWIMACVLERTGVFAALYRGVLRPAIGPMLGDRAASLAFAIAFVAFWWLLMFIFATYSYLIDSNCCFFFAITFQFRT